MEEGEERSEAARFYSNPAALLLSQALVRVQQSL